MCSIDVPPILVFLSISSHVSLGNFAFSIVYEGMAETVDWVRLIPLANERHFIFQLASLRLSLAAYLSISSFGNWIGPINYGNSQKGS